MHEIFIDYLQYSTLITEEMIQGRGDEKIPPLKFYQNGYKNALGLRTYFGNPNSNKALVIASGDTLHNMRTAYWTDEKILQEIIANNGIITRLDTAITDYIEDDLITVGDVAKACENGKVSGTLASYGYMPIAKGNVGQPSGIETCYIGLLERRGKNGIFRAYDKGIELGLEKYLITRLELEERGSNAHNSAKRICEGASMQSTMKSRIQFHEEKFNRVFDQPACDISRGDGFRIESDDEKIDARWQWLMKQVAPSLREAVDYDRENGKTDTRMMSFLRKSGIIE